MNLERPIVAAAAQIAPVFMKKKESIEKYAETDCMGHYSRWDVVSLRLSDEDFGPTGPTRPRRISWEDLERVAEKHSLPPEKLEAIARDLEGLAVEVDP